MNKNLTTNIIRFVAAIFVIFSHSFAIAQNQYDYLGLYTGNIINFGAFSVSVLFVISGYYIMKSIDKKGVNKFVKKRVLRLIPSLFIVVILSVIILGIFFSNLPFSKYITDINTYKYLLNIIFIPIHNLPGVFVDNIYCPTVNGALWTMIVQFLCYIYIYFAYLLKIANKNNTNKYLIISFVLALIGYLVLRYLNMIILISMIRPFLCFVVGSYLYYNENLNKKVILSASIIMSFICLLINNYISLNIFLIFCVSYIVIYLCNNYNVKTDNKILDSVFSSSYELYLVGFPIQQAFAAVNGGSMNIYLNFIAGLIIAIPFSIVIRLLSEKMIQVLKF